MSFVDELKRLAHPYEDDEDELDEEYEEDYEEEEEEEEEYSRPSRRQARAERPASSRPASSAGGSFFGSSQQQDKKVVNITPAAQMQVVLVKPESFSNADKVADHLMERRTVVLNLEKTEKNVSRRLLDFLSGVAYANRGKIQRVAASTYIITPYNVEVTGALRDEMESNGLFAEARSAEA